MTKYTEAFLSPLVVQSISMGQLLDLLKLKRTGGNYRNIRKYVSSYHLDTTHWLGQGWAKGQTVESHSSVAHVTKSLRTPDSEVFKENSTYSTSKLGKRLRNLGVEYKCATCGICDWNGHPLTLHVDHINGQHHDNRLKNLRFLCPNCHQQTDTWGNKMR